MHSEKWPYRIAVLQIVLLVIAAALLLTRNDPSPSLPTPAGKELRIEYRTVHSIEDIVPITDHRVPAIAYTSVLSFADLEVAQKKQKFFDLLLPSVLISQHKLKELRQKIAACLKKEPRSESDQKWLDAQLELFGANDYQQLLRRTKPHPTSIVLAQAALESGWGESRFFEQANNVFGVWSFNPAEPRVKAYESREGKDVFVKKYDSLIASVDDYFLTIARGPYLKFRYARLEENDPTMLVNYLTRYSEQGEEYTRRLREVILKNDLQRFDACRLDPSYAARAL